MVNPPPLPGFNGVFAQKVPLFLKLGKQFKIIKIVFFNLKVRELIEAKNKKLLFGQKLAEWC